ncbi:hypothetical protein BJY01DRAFT_32951 [Aspergillus pseudoustus]|uniref:Uncharacterized protein n=1 Tax=Aspergillus pseudoustus TaxID=1810923 RepID=A0ABR4JF88_9EURO
MMRALESFPRSIRLMRDACQPVQPGDFMINSAKSDSTKKPKRARRIAIRCSLSWPHRFTPKHRKAKLEQQPDLRKSSDVEMVGEPENHGRFKRCNTTNAMRYAEVRPVSTTFLLFTSADAGYWRGSAGETRPSGVWTIYLDKLGLVGWMSARWLASTCLDQRGSMALSDFASWSSFVERGILFYNELHQSAPPA